MRVAPLLGKVKWGQGTTQEINSNTAFFNYYSPNRYVAGCVSVSAGQVMNFHQHPSVGIGVHTYPITVDGQASSATTRGGDGKGGPYVWSDMPESLDSSYYDVETGNEIQVPPPTAAQREQAASLLADIGATINTKYTIEGTCADHRVLTKQMIDVFQYKNAVHSYLQLGGSYANDAKAKNKIYQIIHSNLDAKLPVILGINSTQYHPSEHSAVIDGYGYENGALYYHVNLGWEGDFLFWWPVPTIRTFDTINDCIYNIMPEGTGEIISGRVLDSAGNPIPYASVWISGPYNILIPTKMANAQGIYAFSKLRSDSTYTITSTFGGRTFKKLEVSVGKSTGTTSTTAETYGNVWGADLQEGQGVVEIKNEYFKETGTTPTPTPSTPTPAPTTPGDSEPSSDWPITEAGTLGGAGGGGCNAGMLGIVVAIFATVVTISSSRGKRKI
jgi:hypothetical protein